MCPEQFIRLTTTESKVKIRPVRYCRFGKFCVNFIFENSVKRHISDVKNSRLRQDLPRSINDRVILPFREGFNFTKLRCRSFTKIKSSRNFRNLQYYMSMWIAKPII